MAAGNMKAVVAARQAHPGAETVQVYGCDALRCLVHDRPTNQTLVVASGIEAVMAAQQAHLDMDAVQAEGCDALGKLVADHPASQTAVVAAGSIDAVIVAQQAHLGVKPCKPLLRAGQAGARPFLLTQ